MKDYKKVPSAKKHYIKGRERVLKDFGIKVTSEMIAHMESLYPKEILIEHYTRELILKKLDGKL